jgi:ATP-dependent Zn protease
LTVGAPPALLAAIRWTRREARGGPGISAVQYAATIADAVSMPSARAFFPLIVVVLLVYLASQTFLSDSDGDRIAYSELIATVEKSPESIASVVFVPKTHRLEVRLADGRALESNYPSEGAQLEFQHLLQSKEVAFDSKGMSDSAWWSILTYLLPFILFFGFWIFLMRQVQTGKRRKDEPETDSERF